MCYQLFDFNNLRAIILVGFVGMGGGGVTYKIPLIIDQTTSSLTIEVLSTDGAHTEIRDIKRIVVYSHADAYVTGREE